MVAKMLTGSQSKDLAGLRLDKLLDTFGLMDHLKQTEAIVLLETLIQHGLIEQLENQKFRPVVQLTVRGTDAMCGVATLTEPITLDAELIKKLKKSDLPPSAPPPVTPPPPALPPPPETSPTDFSPDPAAFEPDTFELVETPPVRETCAARSLISRFHYAGYSDPSPMGQPQPAYYWTWRVWRQA